MKSITKAIIFSILAMFWIKYKVASFSTDFLTEAPIRPVIKPVLSSKIVQPTPRHPRTEPLLVYGLHRPSDFFVGRLLELKAIAKCHAAGKHVVLSGERGNGKTELARKYSVLYLYNKFSNIIWVNCTSVRSMHEDMKNLADELFMAILNKDLGSQMGSIFRHFKRLGGNTLFVFDNAEPGNPFLQHVRYYLRGSHNVRVLVTSPYQYWDLRSFTVIIINRFTTQDAIEFLHSVLGQHPKTTATEDDYLTLARAMKFIPVALRKAADYIFYMNVDEGVHYTIEEFINEMDKLGFKDLPGTYAQEDFDEWRDIFE